MKNKFLKWDFLQYKNRLRGIYAKCHWTRGIWACNADNHSVPRFQEYWAVMRIIRVSKDFGNIGLWWQHSQCHRKMCDCGQCQKYFKVSMDTGLWWKYFKVSMDFEDFGQWEKSSKSIDTLKYFHRSPVSHNYCWHIEYFRHCPKSIDTLKTLKSILFYYLLTLIPTASKP
jgi:hypothetical protein